MLHRISGKKEFLARTLCRTRATQLIQLIRRYFRRHVPVLSYHRIVTLDEGCDYPFDRSLISASEAEFDWQIQYVRRHYQAITFRDVLEMMRRGEDLPRQSLIITFDDGFEDNYTNAFRILRCHDVKAVFFISTGYPESGSTYWFDWLAYQIVRMISCDLAIPVLDFSCSLTGKSSDRKAVYEELVDRLKQVSNSVRLDVLEFLRTEYGDMYARASSDDRALSCPMSWSQVAEMGQWGMEIGSHAVSHPILSKLTEDELRAELRESYRDIGKHVGMLPVTIAYPNGQARDFDDKVISAARDVGYGIGVSHIKGSNTIERTGSFGVRRIHIDSQMSRDRFVTELTVPEL